MIALGELPKRKGWCVIPCQDHRITGVLLSGGLDSTILLGHLLEQGQPVQPIHIRTGFVWQPEETRAARRVVRALAAPQREPSQLAGLVVLDMPAADLYPTHWSVTGEQVPDDQSPDDAVYLPGHNVLLLVKAMLWCQLRGIGRLALGSLASNPFADATPEFFAPFQAALNRATRSNVHIVRPFETWTKKEVMARGQRYPLESTFSCLAPVGGQHCGRCNKCAERQEAFRLLAMDDPTDYASVELRVES